mgnify:CR=1
MYDSSSEEVRSSVWKSCYKSSAYCQEAAKPTSSRFGIGSVSGVLESENQNVTGFHILTYPNPLPASDY